MSLQADFIALGKLFESEFGGSIWGNSPDFTKKPTGNTDTLDKPSLITLSLTGEEINSIISSLDSIPNSGNLIAKLKQSLI